MNQWNGAEPTEWSDDALLDAIGRGAVSRDPTMVEQILIGWRSEVHRCPVGELVSTDEATAVVTAAGRAPWWKRAWRRLRR